MQLFIDSADPAEIREAWSYGIVDGVTTNPSLAAKVGKPYSEIVKEVFSIVDGPVSLEVIATDFDGMVAQARKLAKINENVVVKIPCTVDGLRVVKVLKVEGIKTNVTLVFSLAQATLVGKVGADYCSPFIGRLDDVKKGSGLDVVFRMKKIFDNYSFKTKILAASIRSVSDLENVAIIGADVATVPFKILTEMYKHSLTDKGITRFLDDWNNAGLELPVSDF